MVATEAHLPKILTALPGPKAKAAVEADARFVSPPYTRVYPLVVERGHGCILEDVDGNTFLDFNAGIAVCSTGHSHPKVVDAIQRQSAKFLHMSGTDFYYPHMAELAERLAATFPGPGEKKVYFGNSGTEAIEAAMKLARYSTGRDKFIAFHGCFHGRTMGALSLTSSKLAQRRRFGPLVPGVYHAPYPDAAYIENQLFRALVPPEEVAAIVVEPIQGEGGYLIPPHSFLQELRQICDRHGILLVVDEVQSGCGRTGKMWAIEHTGVVPDIICSAKGIASGMPLSATIARAEIMSWKPGAHASTFGGNPVCIAAALATLDLLESELMANATDMGKFILDRISGWPSRHKMVRDVRGRGLMVAIELISHDARDRIVQEAFQRGLLILGAGESALRLMPPLVVTREQASFALDVIEELCSTADERR